MHEDETVKRELAKLLTHIGWVASNDAQHTRLLAAIGEIRRIVSHEAEVARLRQAIADMSYESE